jgi:hypothetical protein
MGTLIKCSFCGVSDHFEPRMWIGQNCRICRACVIVACEALEINCCTEHEPGEGLREEIEAVDGD